MWYSLNESLSNFCGSAFWDTDLTWNSPYPHFTSCFNKTFLTWLPCMFLWIFAPWEIFHFLRSAPFHIRFNWYNVSKLVIIALLGLRNLLDMANIYFSAVEKQLTYDVIAALLNTLTFCLFFGLTYANMKYGVRSSGIHFMFSLLLTGCGAPEFWTTLNSERTSHISTEITNNIKISSMLYTIYYPLVVILLLLNCFADAAPAAKIHSPERNICPENESSFLSKILFMWFDGLAWKCFKNKEPLTADDVWTLDEARRTKQIVEKFESKWPPALEQFQKTAKADSDVRFEREKLLSSKNGIYPSDGSKVYHCGRNRVSASIFRPLCVVFGFRFICGFLFFFLDSAFELGGPLILKYILEFVGNKDEISWHGYFYSFILFGIQVSKVIFVSRFLHIGYQVGLEIRTILISLIYKKALRISNRARKSFSLGAIDNLMAVDTQAFVQIATSSALCMLYPAQISASFYFLWKTLGPCVLTGITMLIIIVAVNAVIVSRIQRLQMKQMKYKDKRVKLTSEVISGIKVLKLYAWEPSFEEQIHQIRNEEIKILKDIVYLRAGSTFTWICTPFLVTFFTFALYVLSNENNVLDPEIAFVSLSLFNILKLVFKILPAMITLIIRANVARKRIDKFLNAEELDPDAVSHEQCSQPMKIKNGEFSWDSQEGSSILTNINLSVDPGTLVAVIGPVGSGKSSLLSAMLGEMHKVSGWVNTTGKIAYVPQQAWILNTSLRDNITFGDTMRHASFYDEVLESCALIPDLKVLPGGDQAEIGEKGINLSGGQKQRISLARAVYSEADTYLLDDSLSAVDANVGKHIFEHVIGPNGLLRKKTRIFVTHNVSYLPQVDHIIVLHNGMISHSGTYTKLLEAGGDFANFLATFSNNYDEHTGKRNSFEHEEKILENNVDQLHHNRRPDLLEANKNDDKEANKVKNHKLTEKEETRFGNIKWSVIRYYFGAMGYMMVVVVLTNVICQLFSVASDYWLSIWSDEAKNLRTTNSQKGVAKQYVYMGVYALFGVGQAVGCVSQTLALYTGALKAAKYIHNHLMNSVLHWASTTFDRIPTGRIINRFGFDVDVMDNNLPESLFDFMTYAAMGISTLCVVSYNLPLLVGVILPVGAGYYFIQRISAAISKQLVRLESTTKSPIYSHFSDTVTGTQSIRAYNLTAKFIQDLENKIDFNLKHSFASTVGVRWFSVRIDLLAAFIVFSITLLAVFGRNTISPALVGLVITYAFQITTSFYWCVRTGTQLETNIIAVERIKEYGETEQEAPWMIPNTDTKVPQDWPNKGVIEFENVHVQYRKDLEPVLKGVSFKVHGGEKVGIVGRTGAGKSSLTLSLFRIIESSGGSILIDGIDVSKIGLHKLRSRLTIIPQDPVLFSGTLRINLDPAGQYSDESIWNALELTNLKNYVSTSSAGLQYVIDESGSNFSVGQRQLVCLARALLRKTRILILDEATSAVDLETDNFIQATIRKEFKDCTVLTIAHRLNTVLDYERIMVLDKGYIAEFGPPKALLESKQSIFYNMAVDFGLVTNSLLDEGLQKI